MARDGRIRVLHVIPYIGLGGADRHLTELAKHFDRRRYELKIAYYSSYDRLRGELEGSGISLVRLPKGGRGSPLLHPALIRLILRERPHIVHTWLFAANVWGRLAAAICGVPVIIAYELTCDPGRPLLHRVIERAVARISHCVMVNNWPAAELLMKTERVPRELFRLVENGVDLARLDAANDSDGAEWRRAMGIADDAFLFGVVARMTAEKGHAVLWQALAASGQRHRLLVVGDGPLRPSLRAAAKRMGIADLITFAGAREDIPMVMKAIDCLVIPSLREGLPNVALEAMASHRPVIAADVGACAEVVVDGKTGWLVPPRDAAALAAAMGEAAADPEGARRLGDVGRAMVEERFQVQHMVAAMDRVYSELLAARGVRRRGVAYIISRFPKLSETFILREVNALERLGWQVEPFTLAASRALDWSHDAAQPWRGRVRRADAWCYLSLPWVHAIALLTLPRTYLSTLAAIVRLVGWRRFYALVRHLGAFALGVRLARRVRRFRHLHAHFAWVSATAAWTAARLSGLEYSLTIHGSDVQRPRLIGEFLIRKLTDAQFIICVSASLRERVRSLLRGREMPPIHVVHTGLDRSALDDPRPPAPGALRRPRLLSVGRLASEKGHRHLLAAVRYLRDRTIDVRLDVIGDGPEHKRLQGDIDRLELRRAVRLRGAMSEQDVWARYRRADIFVLPSLREGLPVALLEAMAAGLPVVVSDLPGVREAVEHEQTGLLVPPGDSTALAEAISRLIADPELRARLSAAARQVVEDYFLIEDNIRDLAALFEDET